MSEITDITLAVVQERAPWTSDPCKNLRTGKLFTAEIDGSPDALLLLTELGEDYRNCCILHVLNDTEAAEIQMGDEVQFTLFGTLSTWKVLKRRDSSAQVQANFWCQQLTDKDS